MSGQPYNQDIIIPDHLQRRRIGLTVYLFVKKLYRKPICNFWPGDQSAKPKAYSLKWGDLLAELELGEATHWHRALMSR